MITRYVERISSRTRLGLRRLLWWIWPSPPTSWRAVPARLRPAGSQIARLAVSAMVAYLVAGLVTPGVPDLTAPLTALLVVQVSTVGTLRMGLVRVGAVVTGVLVAVGVASAVGLTWWSLGGVIVVSLVLARLLRLGEQALEVPISAMLILAVSAPELAAETRIVNTLVGTLVGVGFSFVVPVSIPNVRAVEKVRSLARAQAGLLNEIALTLADRAPAEEEVEAWLDWSDAIDRDTGTALAAVQAAEDSRRFNPRALTTAKVHPGLRTAVDRLGRCLDAERSLILVIGKEAPEASIADAFGTDLRRAFAVVLDDLADALRAYGALVHAEYGRRSTTDVEELLDSTLHIVQETRAVLTELLLLEVEARQQQDLWLLRSSVLAAVEQVLHQLDVELLPPAGEGWLGRHGVRLFDQQ